MQKNCEYFNGIQKDQVINPNTVGREECQKEGSNLVLYSGISYMDMFDVVILQLEFM